MYARTSKSAGLVGGRGGVVGHVTTQAAEVVVRIDGHQFELRPSANRKRLEIFAGGQFVTALDVELGHDVTALSQDARIRGELVSK